MIIKTVSLRSLAYARSGDKGSHANIGVIAYTSEGYDFLVKYLTAEKLQNYFKPLGCTFVQRYELHNLHALNFVLFNVLAEGASRSLRLDAQGKALGQVLLEMHLDFEEEL